MYRVFLVVAVLLTGCATTANYEKIWRSWVGSSEKQLVSSWGVPDRTYEASGTKYLVYGRSSTAFIPGTPPSYQTTFVGNTAYTTPVGGTAPMAVNMSCVTTFEVEADTIRRWRWQGNNCTALPPK